MVFSSLTFLLVFLPVTLALYFARADLRWRNGVLLVMSLLFYAWGEPIWVLAMVASTAVNYFCALKMAKTKKKKKRRAWMALGVSMSAAILFVFKYAAFFINSLLSIAGAEARLRGFELPIGISFYTFQVITYTVDVYRRKVKPQKKLSTLMLYVCCFPQLIAGPIVQYADVAGQLTDRAVTPDGFTYGCGRLAMGLGKKVVFANICGAALKELPLVGSGAALSALGGWYAALLYTLQIYFDFSGYSDMAIGLGRMLGFRYKENFDHPYASHSVREFWRRWHISLGSFFRDYVYIPLGGNRRGTARTVLNTLVVWGLTGLWHGASWSFVVWGLYFGVILTIDILGGRTLWERLPKGLQWALTMAIVTVSWVIFYYPALGDGLRHVGAMFGFGASGFLDRASLTVMKKYTVFPLLAFAASLPVGKAIVAKLRAFGLRGRGMEIAACAWLTGCMVLSVLLLVGQSYNPFIYFQF